MWKSSEIREVMMRREQAHTGAQRLEVVRGEQRRSGWGWVFFGLMVALPISGLSAVSSGKAPPVKPAKAVEDEARPGGSYQLRCWQYGKLIVEENGLSIPSTSESYSLKMHRDGGGMVMLLEKGSSTCLAKPMEGGRAPVIP